jgi:hypothetical protein
VFGCEFLEGYNTYMCQKHKKVWSAVFPNFDNDIQVMLLFFFYIQKSRNTETKQEDNALASIKKLLCPTTQETSPNLQKRQVSRLETIQLFLQNTLKAWVLMSVRTITAKYLRDFVCDKDY